MNTPPTDVQTIEHVCPTARFDYRADGRTLSSRDRPIDLNMRHLSLRHVEGILSYTRKQSKVEVIPSVSCTRQYRATQCQIQCHAPSITSLNTLHAHLSTESLELLMRIGRTESWDRVHHSNHTCSCARHPLVQLRYDFPSNARRGLISVSRLSGL